MAIKSDSGLASAYAGKIKELNVNKLTESKGIQFTNLNGLKDAEQVNDKMKSTLQDVSSVAQKYGSMVDQLAQILSQTDDELGA